MNKEYIIYHIPGKKIGVTNDLYNRVECQQGYEIGEYYHFAHNLHLYNNIIEKL